MCAGIHLYLHLPAIHAYTDSDCYGNSYIYADAYGDGNTDCDGDSDSYAYFDTETFTDSKSCANAQAACHPATALVVRQSELEACVCAARGFSEIL